MKSELKEEIITALCIIVGINIAIGCMYFWVWLLQFLPTFS